MSVLSAAGASRFRATLQTRTDVLREEIWQVLLRSDDERYLTIAEQARDAEDNSFADLIIEVNLAEIDRDVAELRDIYQALGRLAEGTYGRCEMCAEEIAHARWEAQPAATRCLSCQTEFEQSRPQRTPRL